MLFFSFKHKIVFALSHEFITKTKIFQILKNQFFNKTLSSFKEILIYLPKLSAG